MVTSDRRDASGDVDPGFLESVIESQLGPVVTVDEDCVIRYASDRVAALLGRDRLVGRSLATVVASDLAPDRAETIRERLSADRVADGDPIRFPAVCADGVERVLAFGARRHIHDGETLYSGQLVVTDAPADGDADGTVIDEVVSESDRADATREMGATREFGATQDIGSTRETNGSPEADASREVDWSREADGLRDVDAFRKIVECAGHGIYITDTDGEILYVNAAFEETTGYEAVELIGRTPAVLDSGEMSDEYFDRLWESIERGEVWSEEIINRRKDGEPYYANQTIAPVYGDDEIVRYVAIQTDVTHRKETEERLRTYRNVVELLEDPIMLQNRDGSFEVTNEAVSEFAGLSRVELHGNDEFAFMDEHAAALIDDQKRSVLESEEPATYTVDATFTETGRDATFTETGREATFRTTRYPYYDAAGDLVGTVAICRDVTDLERRHRALKRYERAIVGATDLIAAVDEEDRFLFANPRYAAFHGVDAGSINGKRLDELLPEETYRTIEPNLARARRGRDVSFRMTRQHPQKGERTVDVQYYPLRESDDATGVVAVLRDVTDRENRTRQLRVVDRVLQHNIRNDLTLIRGHAERVRDIGGPEAAESAEVVLEYADDLLTTSRKSRAVTEILSDTAAQEPIDVGATVRAVSESTSLSYPDARVSVEGPAAAVAFATPELETAIEELVTNAIVHNDREEPTVEIRVESCDGRVRIRVCDDGPGIAEMDRAVVEEGTATEALYHGSGLGLWLVYWVLSRSGGNVEIESIEPRGTRVTLCVPAYGPEDGPGDCEK